MQKWEFIIGVDVSKKTLDVYCHQRGEHLQIENGKSGFRQLQKWIKAYNIDMKNCIVAMEYTGGYEYQLLQFCESRQIPYVRIPGLAIKRSLGIIRGKNDMVDSMRIAQYVEEKYKLIEPSKPLNKKLKALKELLSFRKRCVRESAGYKATLKERKHIYPEIKGDFISKELERKIKENKKVLQRVEAQIMALIDSDEAIKTNYSLLVSIKGIGKINALMTIAYTENFTAFTDGRCYAVYAGVIPFDNSSGTSIKGRKHVSYLANKEVKQELTQAAKSAMMHDEEIKDYADKKLKEKAYGIVINNIKFKLILRMFAVVKRQTIYVSNFRSAA